MEELESRHEPGPFVKAGSSQGTFVVPLFWSGRVSRWVTATGVGLVAVAWGLLLTAALGVGGFDQIFSSDSTRVEEVLTIVMLPTGVVGLLVLHAANANFRPGHDSGWKNAGRLALLAGYAGALYTAYLVLPGSMVGSL